MLAALLRSQPVHWAEGNPCWMRHERARDCRKGVLPAVNTTAWSRSPLGRTPLLLPDCDQCGFTSCLVRHGTVVGLLRKYTAEWQRVLTGPGLDGRMCGSASLVTAGTRLPRP